MIGYLEQAKRILEVFWGKEYIYVLFLGCLLLVFVCEHNMLNKQVMFVYPVIVSVFLISPIAFILGDLVWGESSAAINYYCRQFSLIGIQWVIAYGLLLVCSKVNGIKKMFAVIACVCLIIMTGKCIYGEEWYTKAKNTDKMPSDIYEICDYINQGEDVTVLFPESLTTYVRQYDPSIHQLYSTRYKSTDITNMLGGVGLNVAELMKTLCESGCDYVVVDNIEDIMDEFGGQDYLPELITENYLLYKVCGFPGYWKKYDTNEYISEKVYHDENDIICDNSDGYAIVKYSYETYSTIKPEFEYYYDEKDNPAANIYGAYGCHFIYDSDGNNIEQTFIDNYGDSIVISEGYATVERKFDTIGHVLAEYYYDENHNPISLAEGQYGFFRSIDDDCRTTKITYLDQNKNPLNTHEGYSTVEYNYNEDGLVEKITYYDDNGKPVIADVGYASITYKYDEYGNVVEERYWGDDNKSILYRNKEYCGWRKEYNDSSKITCLYYLDFNGEPLMLQDGYAVQTMEYDEKGRVVANYYYDDSFQPVALLHGEYGQKKIWDEDNRLIYMTYTDEFGVPIMTSYGFSSYSVNYDENGNVILRRYFDEFGVPTAVNTGEYGYICEYDEQNRLYKLVNTDIDGNPMNITLGYSYYICSYDEKGSVMYEYFDSNGTKIER